MNRAISDLTQLQDLIERVRAGDLGARDELIRRTADRLHHLAKKMLRDFPHVHRWEDTNDILQNAMMRLLSGLRAGPPTNAQHFFNLAALQIRRELLDLARHYDGPLGLGANYSSHVTADLSINPPSEPAESTWEPGRLAQWREAQERLDQAIEQLPKDECEVFVLRVYLGLSTGETADLLQISMREVQRRWQGALLQVKPFLKDACPAF